MSAIVKVGQVWLDNDPRMTRFVKIIALPKPGFSRVTVCRCLKNGVESIPHTKTEISRFGKRGRDGFTLEVTEVRIQRVQEISVQDAIAEGAIEFATTQPHGGRDSLDGRKRGLPYPKNAYADLWDSLNAKRGFGWETNPWVWAITFRRLP